MPNLKKLENDIFNIQDETVFNTIALEVFLFQYNHNPVYKQYVDYLQRNPETIKHYTQIPFLPIEFFKTHKVTTGNFQPQAIFTSSGTTGNNTSKHYIKSLDVYEKSFLKSFTLFLGSPEEYVIIGLLPSYLEREGSSLIHMTKTLINLSKHSESGFYLNNYDELNNILISLKSANKKTLLIGVTFALLELTEKFPINFPGLQIMETGGMKGRRKEMVRDELHGILKKAFGVEKIYSEYGMTELLSQAYSLGNGLFSTPPWMKTLIRDTDDPFTYLTVGKSGGINIIDLANLYSCSFIETKDLGKIHPNGSFEILGRYDNSDVRGCNLLVV